MGKSGFGGRIGRDWRDSEPWWPPRYTAPQGRPNVRAGRLDDVGFAQLGCYGSAIATPVIDGLAPAGVRLANFHTTALCSPTRACLLTGRNHHRSGMGRVADLAVGYPGLLGQAAAGERLPLRDPAPAGLRHLRRRQVAPDPRQRDRHGLVAGHVAARPAASTAGTASTAARPTSSCPPSSTTTTRSARRRRIEEGYHLSADLADRAIEFLGDLRAVDADRPFFLYLCTGACHSPHQAPSEWIDRYRGAFDGGLGRLAGARPSPANSSSASSRRARRSPRGRPGCRPGTTSTTVERALAARFMECFAGFLSYTDAQLGRVLDFLARPGRAGQHARRAGVGQRRQLRGRLRRDRSTTSG